MLIGNCIENLIKRLRDDRIDRRRKASTLRRRLMCQGWHSPVAAEVETCEDRIMLSVAFDQPTYDFNVPEDATVVGTISATGNNLSIWIQSGNEEGHFYIEDDGSGSAAIEVAEWNPLDYETGPNAFTLTVVAYDMSGNSDTATVTINVTDVNESPTATPTSRNTLGSFPVIFNPAENATDPEGDALTAVIVTIPTNGTLTDNFDGTFTYELTAPTQETFDTFEYRASDGVNQSANTATVTINIDWANFHLEEAIEGDWVQTTEDLSNQIDVTLTLTKPLGYNIYVDLPEGYTPGDFFLEVPVTGPAAVYADAGGATQIAAGDTLALPAPGEPLQVYLFGTDSGIARIGARLKRLQGGVKKLVQKTADKLKEIHKKHIDAWKKFGTVLQAGKQKLKDKAHEKLTDLAVNTPFKKLKDKLKAIVDDNVTYNQTQRDLAQSYITNLPAAQTAMKNQISAVATEQLNASMIFLHTDNANEKDFLKTVQQDVGTANQTKWKPKIKLRADAIINGKIQVAIDDLVELDEDKIKLLFENPQEFLEKATIEGVYTVDGKEVKVNVGVGKFYDGVGADWKNHTYDFKISTPDWNGVKVDMGGTYTPIDPVTGLPKYAASITVITLF